MWIFQCLYTVKIRKNWKTWNKSENCKIIPGMNRETIYILFRCCREFLNKMNSFWTSVQWTNFCFEGVKRKLWIRLQLSSIQCGKAKKSPPPKWGQTKIKSHFKRLSFHKFWVCKVPSRSILGRNGKRRFLHGTITYDTAKESAAYLRLFRFYGQF